MEITISLLHNYVHHSIPGYTLPMSIVTRQKIESKYK